MANKKSSLKRIRQNTKARSRNRAQSSALRTTIKKVRAAIDSKDLKLAEQSFKEAESAISSAATRKLIHRANASRKISRLAAAVNTLRA